MQGLVPVEIAAFAAVALVGWPASVPVVLPLFVVASLARWARGRSWGELVHGGGAAVGAVAGLAALGLAVIVGTPVVETVSDRAVEWSTFPTVRGSTAQLVPVLLYVAATSFAAELALRGWIVERVVELAEGRPHARTLAIMLGALAEALLAPGDLAARLGAALFGLGLGAMYLAGGRSLVAPTCARIVFACGAVLLQAMRVIG